MKRRLLALGFLLATTSVAGAQAITSFDASDAVAPISVVEGPGVRVGEGTVLHPIVGFETGFVSNVFYEENNTHAGGLLRLLAEVGTGSLTRQRLTKPGGVDVNENPIVASEEDEGRTEVVDNQGSLQYRADVRVSYDFMMSTNDAVAAQGGLGVGADFRGLVNPGRPLQFSFIEDFQRMIRAANFESDADTNRDVNHVNLRLLYQPAGRSVAVGLHYENAIDVFESQNQQFANRLQHTFGLRGLYQWLPVTRLYVDFHMGVFTGLGDSTKVDSYPLVAEAGIQTLLSLRTTLVAHAGYTNGFYASGPSYSAPIAGAQLGYRYSPLGRATLMYDYLHNDSINANFYRDHVIRFYMEQGFVPFIVDVQPEIHFREYDGVTLPGATSMVRDDVILAVAASVHYNLRNWFAITLDYHFSSVQTDFRYMPTPGLIDDPSYVRHELLLGMRAAL